MKIHLWHGSNEQTELLLTPEQDTSKAPAPQTGGSWTHHSEATMNRHSTDPLPGGVSWEELNAAFTFSGFWQGAGELPT